MGRGIGREGKLIFFRSVAETAGLPTSKRHPHVLKHTLASHLIGANVNLAKVAQYLGHRAISSTMRYVSVSDTQASDAAREALTARPGVAQATV